MVVFKKHQELAEHFKELYNDEIWHSIYRYVNILTVDEKKIFPLMEYLNKCDELGLSFYFYSIVCENLGRLLVGFSNFDITAIDQVYITDLTCLDSDDVNEYFDRVLKRDGYYICNNDFFKPDIFEEIPLKYVFLQYEKEDGLKKLATALIKELNIDNQIHGG